MICPLWKGTIYGQRARYEYTIGKGEHEGVESMSKTAEMLGSEMLCFLSHFAYLAEKKERWIKNGGKQRAESECGMNL